MYFKALFLSIIITCFLFADTAYYYNRETHLSGKLITKLYYGPPGFGEDKLRDKKVYPFILILEKPIFVKGDSENQDESGITQVQLAFPYEDIDKIKKLKNMKVYITGSLFHSDNGNHYTKVLIDVKKVKQE